MQDIAFLKAVFNAIPINESYLEVYVDGGMFRIQPQKLLLPGELGNLPPKWKNIIDETDASYFAPSGSNCFVIEGFEVDLDDKQDPFYLKARAVLDVNHVNAVVEKWIG
ncbi:MAG: hypothetical protein AAF297_05130 [Planctomycetota bacterium]